MNKNNIAQVPVERRRSPKGRFEIERQHVSPALGGKKKIGPWGGGHPFDIELTKLPPGRANFPVHSHAAQTEHCLILSGTGILRDDKGGEERLIAGDHVVCHPGDAHQIENDGTEPLVFYVIADHHRADVGTHSRTGKRRLSPEARAVAVADADYYAGEEWGLFLADTGMTFTDGAAASPTRSPANRSRRALEPPRRHW